jgi:D-amino-acid dehydrogenase
VGRDHVGDGRLCDRTMAVRPAGSSVRRVSSPDVVVIGAGAVGMATALEMAGRGATVLVLERGPTPAAGCSAGNAGIVGAGHVTPLAGPEVLRDGIRLMFRRHGAFAVRARPASVPWLARFLWASSERRYQFGVRVLGRLARESAELHRALGGRLDTGFVNGGLLGVYQEPAALAAASALLGAPNQVLDGRAAHAACPQLVAEPAGAIFSPDEAHCDPERFVGALADAARELGVQLSTGVEVLAIRRRRGRAIGLWTTAGDVAAGEVVLAAGAWSSSLARGLPVAVPIQGGKGYHVDFADAAGDPTLPVHFPEHRVVATPLSGRLRVSGMLQLAGTDLRVDRGRVDTIARHAGRLLTGLRARRVLRVWRGLRPCTPDGLPIVGRVPGVENLTLATGHGMWGLQLAPVTARLVAGLLTGDPDAGSLSALRPERFSLLSRRPALSARRSG